jgi:hypothetical protein
MPSNSYRRWVESRSAKLDQMEDAHASVGGTRRGRRYATDQINQAYAVLLASQFQGFCRDLHTESVEYLVDCLTSASMRPIVQAELLRDRKLDRGNANPGNLGDDFKRLGVDFWGEVRSLHFRTASRRDALEKLNQWRNAIAHQKFDPAILGDAKLGLAQVRRWRKACGRLSKAFDRVMWAHIRSVTGHMPWS